MLIYLSAAQQTAKSESGKHHGFSWSLKTKQQGQPMRETRKSFKRNHEQEIIFCKKLNNFFGEFDPGSGRTLAACLTHASRTENLISLLREFLVADG